MTSAWLASARRVASPNFDPRPNCAPIELLVIHAISLPPRQFGSGDIARLFTNQLDPDAHPYFRDIDGLRVSAHFLIDRRGALTQFVALDQRAWHAGESSWCGRQACNDFSVGIELEGCDDLAFTDAQYGALAALIGELYERYPALRASSPVGHADIAPGRKTDPGPLFDWARFARDLSA